MLNTETTAYLSADIIDIRDLIDRFETLESYTGNSPRTPDEQSEFEVLANLLIELGGSGGDHKWRGTWYPDVLVADAHFTAYAQQLAEDIGAVDPHAGWPVSHIDWDAAADALQADYSAIEVNGTTYWYR